MKSRHLVDKELVAMLDAFPPMTFSAETLADARGFMKAMGEAAVPPPLPVEAERRMIPGPKGAPEVPVHIYRPKGTKGPLPAYLDIHGGGYIGGTPLMGDVRNRTLAHELQCVIVSVDYRVAPETPFPGPVEDCYAGLLWLQANAKELGADPKRIAIGGDSAGGGLAAALALVARDRGVVPVILQVLIYPMLDDRTSTVREDHPYAGEFMWTPASNRYGWTSYLGKAPGGPDTPGHAAPARAANLAGLPPAFIAVGALDLFIDEDIEYAQRLIRAGVPTELHVYPGAFHGFDLVPDATSTKAIQASMRTALKRAFTGT